MFINITNVVGLGGASSTTWKSWLGYVMQHKSDFQLSKTALVYQKGSVAASSPEFPLKSTDIKEIKESFKDPSKETLRFQGNTYCVRSVGPTQLIAFVGHHYLIVSRTQKMFIITLCDSRHTVSLAAGWINRIAEKLVEKNF